MSMYYTSSILIGPLTRQNFAALYRFIYNLIYIYDNALFEKIIILRTIHPKTSTNSFNILSDWDY